MRISTQVLVDRSLARLNERLVAFERTQIRLATGRQFETSSEDVNGMNTALALRSPRRSVEQATRNAQDGKTRVDLTDSKMQQMLTIMRRARDLTIRASSTTQSVERLAIVEEINTINTAMVELANSKHLDHGLFSGFAAGDAVTNTAGVWNYTGDSGDVDRRISETEIVTTNVVGDDVFGFSVGDNVFAMLEQLSTDIVAGDAIVVSDSLDDIDNATRRIELGLVQIGAVANRIDAALETNLETDERLRLELSSVEDVDLAEAIVDLQIQETGLQATLGALARALQPSLIDFLR